MLTGGPLDESANGPARVNPALTLGAQDWPNGPQAEEDDRMRVRLKADGRLVEIMPDGSERKIAAGVSPTTMEESQPDYARRVRAATRLTQAEFAARIGVPVDTVRNWEQGKRAPRGPARALLKLIEHAPEAAFAALAR